MPRSVRLTLALAVAVMALGVGALPASAGDSSTSVNCQRHPEAKACQKQTENCANNPTTARCQAACTKWQARVKSGAEQLAASRTAYKKAKRAVKKAKTRRGKRRARKRRKAAKALYKGWKTEYADRLAAKPSHC